MNKQEQSPLVGLRFIALNIKDQYFSKINIYHFIQHCIQLDEKSTSMQ